MIKNICRNGKELFDQINILFNSYYREESSVDKCYDKFNEALDALLSFTLATMISHVVAILSTKGTLTRSRALYYIRDFLNEAVNQHFDQYYKDATRNIEEKK